MLGEVSINSDNSKRVAKMSRQAVVERDVFFE